MKEFKVNSLITLRLIDGKTVLLVNGQEFKQCKMLLLNVLVESEEVEALNSIDEIAEDLDFRMETKRDFVNVTEEEEFKGHCSNLQVWAENLYDTELLHKSLAFPLLKALSENGDRFAKQRFAEEIIRRYKYGNKTVRSFLIEEGYLSGSSSDNIIDGILIPREAAFLEKIMEFGENYEIVPYFYKMAGISHNKSYLSLNDGKIRELEIRIGDDLNRIPREIENLSNLNALYISVNRLYYGNLFEEEFSLPSLKRLVIDWDSAEDIPDSFYYFPNLRCLQIKGPYERQFKPYIYFEKSGTKLAHLRELELYFLDIKKIPMEVIEKLQEKKVRISL
ncbi:hypothetical protein LCGC14_0414900 [marine sediment metagenome]|uniref:Uncharacterized protein n=1 Tax=marine sediment metagenome TaxID=412755 RepID=A0A0F9W1S3_9ZZZZ